MVVGLMPL